LGTFLPARPMRRLVPFLALAAFVLAGCGGPRAIVGSPVVPVRVGPANAYLLLGTRPVIVDPGGPGHVDALREALAARDFAPSDVALIVLTHGHADHAGAADAWARLSGAPVVAGAADTAMLAAGDHGALRPMGLEARLIRPFIGATFPPVRADRVLAPGDTLDLRPFGLTGSVRTWPGHTGGSLVVVFDGAAGREAVVGDLFRGGAMGGRIRPSVPHRHYFHEDADAAEAAVPALLADGVACFYLGHGGPVDASAARRRFSAAQAR